MEYGLEFSEEKEQKKLHGLYTPINSKSVTLPSSSTLVTTMLQNVSTPGQ
jgi:hypothetical protein